VDGVADQHDPAAVAWADAISHSSGRTRSREGSSRYASQTRQVRPPNGASRRGSSSAQFVGAVRRRSSSTISSRTGRTNLALSAPRRTTGDLSTFADAKPGALTDVRTAETVLTPRRVKALTRDSR
jgi:hypothetical protein